MVFKLCGNYIWARNVKYNYTRILHRQKAFLNEKFIHISLCIDLKKQMRIIFRSNCESFFEANFISSRVEHVSQKFCKTYFGIRKIGQLEQYFSTNSQLNL